MLMLLWDCVGRIAAEKTSPFIIHSLLKPTMRRGQLFFKMHANAVALCIIVVVCMYVHKKFGFHTWKSIISKNKSNDGSKCQPMNKLLLLGLLFWFSDFWTSLVVDNALSQPAYQFHAIYFLRQTSFSPYYSWFFGQNLWRRLLPRDMLLYETRSKKEMTWNLWCAINCRFVEEGRKRKKNKKWDVCVCATAWLCLTFVSGVSPHTRPWSWWD